MRLVGSRHIARYFAFQIGRNLLAQKKHDLAVPNTHPDTSRPAALTPSLRDSATNKRNRHSGVWSQWRGKATNEEKSWLLSGRSRELEPLLPPLMVTIVPIAGQRVKLNICCQPRSIRSPSHIGFIAFGWIPAYRTLFCFSNRS